jgi:ribosomal protein S9
MEWMPDGRKLWDAIKKYDPTILSSPSNHVSSVEGKKTWLKKNLPEVSYIIEKHKEKYADKDSVLIDDREKNIKKWEEAGGIGILYKNAEDTIKKLEDIMTDKKKDAAAKVVEDPSGRRVVVPQRRMHDVFMPQQMRRHVVPPQKGIGAPYKRKEFKRIDIPEDRESAIARVVLSYLKSKN